MHHHWKEIDEIEVSIKDTATTIPTKTPDVPKPTLPTAPVVKPTTVKDPETNLTKPVTKPTVKPETPEKPETPSPPVEKYTDIFYNANWIYNTHLYVTPESLLVSSSSGLLTGMGAVA